MTQALIHDCPTAQPRVAGLMPAALFCGLPAEPSEAADALGLASSRFGHIRDGALQAELEVPQGAWRVWPKRGVAAWLARGRASAAPPTRVPLARLTIDLMQAITRLHGHGLWCSELRLLTEEGWTSSLPIRDALEWLADGLADVTGLSALWSDGYGRATRVELFQDGQAWASSPVEAERWLLLATGMADE